MTAAKPQLILFDPDSAVVERLKPYSAELAYISHETGNGPQVTAKAHLDALWTTPMMALEMLGAKWPVPLYRAFVLRTPAEMLLKGIPRYAVVGVAISRDDPREPKSMVRLVVSSLLKAVNDFNAQNQDHIIRIGILLVSLHLDRLDPELAFQIVREVYEVTYPENPGTPSLA